jgi:hypothetical protein
MCAETCKRILFVCAAVVLVQTVIVAQEPTPDKVSQQETTELRIEVTGGEEFEPVVGASVYIEWKEGGETKRKEGTTNRSGIAGPYKVARVTVFIQVSTEDGSWNRKGGDFELKEPKETITINLVRKNTDGALVRSTENRQFGERKG